MGGGGAQDVAVEFMLGLNSGFWRVNGGKKLGFLCTTDVLPISHHNLKACTHKPCIRLCRFTVYSRVTVSLMADFFFPFRLSGAIAAKCKSNVFIRHLQTVRSIRELIMYIQNRYIRQLEHSLFIVCKTLLQEHLKGVCISTCRLNNVVL